MTEIQTKLEAALANRYHFQRLLGAGGMATVYLAKDLRHERMVAVKVLRPELAVVIGAERFLAEIKLTANLQHPHILPLHDSGEADGLVYYVMPYIEGESLRDRVTREHQLPVDEAVRIATEVADALEYAHAHGVIHRDVKPENVLLHGGHALVADFGIALAASRGEGATRMTETGMSLGTPAYMAPEQAMGEREITPKADIYALGAVLYEMLSGEPPFVGPTAQAIVARMMTEEPRPLSLQRHTVPPHVEAAVRKALEKLPADRFASAAEFKAALRDHSFSTARMVAMPSVAGPRRRLVAVLPWAVAALALIAAIIAFLRPDPPAPVRRYGLGLPPGQTVLDYRAIPAPDGSSLLFVGPVPGAQVSDQVFQLWIKHRDRYEAEPVGGTNGAWNATFSPDGRWIAYVGQAQLRKVAVTGGSAVSLADSAAPGQPGIAWQDDGTIVFVERGARALRRVTAAGGPAEVVYRSERQVFEPSPLPGSRFVLAGECATVQCATTNLLAVDLRAGTSQVLVNGAQMGVYVSTGHLLYLRDDNSLFAVQFDPGTLETRGSPVSILDSVAPGVLGPQLAVSAQGMMIVRRGIGRGFVSGQYEMVWLDRTGNATAITMGDPLQIDPGGGNPGWTLSPDGSRLAIGLLTASGGDVWVKQLPNGPLSRVTFDSAPDLRPRWLPDGRNLTFVTDRGAGYELRQTNADGTGEETLMARHPAAIFEGAVSPDGQWIVARVRGGLGRQGRDIVGFRRGDTTAVPLIVTNFDENAFRLSPDGRWIAYESDETGRREVYIRPFPNTNGGKWQASTEGGYAPLWAPSGRELFFVDVQRRMTAVQFTPGAVPRLGERRVLFSMGADIYLWENDYYTPFDISPDGRRFLMARHIGGEAESPVIVVENWFTELRQRFERQ